jgi:hypothetical protein
MVLDVGVDGAKTEYYRMALEGLREEVSLATGGPRLLSLRAGSAGQQAFHEKPLAVHQGLKGFLSSLLSFKEFLVFHKTSPGLKRK